MPSYIDPLANQINSSTSSRGTNRGNNNNNKKRKVASPLEAPHPALNSEPERQVRYRTRSVARRYAGLTNVTGLQQSQISMGLISTAKGAGDAVGPEPPVKLQRVEAGSDDVLSDKSAVPTKNAASPLEARPCSPVKKLGDPGASLPTSCEKALLPAEHLFVSTVTPGSNSQVVDPSTKSRVRDAQHPFGLDVENHRWEHKAVWVDGELLEGRVKTAWKLLEASVLDLASFIGGRGPFLEIIDADTRQRLLQSWPHVSVLSHDAQDLDELCYQQLDFGRAYIWQLLWEYQFSPECIDKWQGKPWAQYGQMHRNLSPHLSQSENSFDRCFHTWRYCSSRMLYAVHGPHSSSRRLAGLLCQGLSGFWAAAPTPGILEGIDRLTGDAIGFDFLIHASKMRVDIQLADPKTGKLHGFPFREEDMENRTKHASDPSPPRETLIEKEGTELLASLLAKPDLKEWAPPEAMVDLVMQPGLRVFGKAKAAITDSDYREYTVDDYSQCNISISSLVTTSVPPQDVGTK